MNQGGKAAHRQAGGCDDAGPLAIAAIATDDIDEADSLQPGGGAERAENRIAKVLRSGKAAIVEEPSDAPSRRGGVDGLDDVQDIVGAATGADDDKVVGHGLLPRARPRNCSMM